MTTVALAALLGERTTANEQFFAAEAPRIAELCRELARTFVGGGRLLAVGGSPQAWSDAHHVAVEFVHPVIVGKRALPALALAEDDLARVAVPRDAVIRFEPLRVTAGGDEWRFDPPTADPFIRQELGETLYHVLWELVHVFFEHLSASDAGAGASSFLYPFLDQGTHELGEVVEDVVQSVLMKAQEVAALREQTLTESHDELLAAAHAVERALEAGGTVFAFGNGGSATDAEDLVADFRSAPQGWSARHAVDLSESAAILSALANDIGADALFQRQLLAHAKPGDVVVALSTSGNSANVVSALATARRLELSSVAFVGYDGGRVAAERLADHVVVTRSEHVPRIQEAQASAYHVLREVVG
jgi:D-sedoheptulose 7-phosphate isomerase